MPPEPPSSQSEESPDGSPDPKAQRKFWIALAAPLPFALLSFLFGNASESLMGVAMLVGIVALFVGFCSSIYCAAWIARRLFVKSFLLRTVFGVFLFAGIGFTYFIVIEAGCSASANRMFVHVTHPKK